MSYCFTCVSLAMYKGIMGNTFSLFLPEYKVSKEENTEWERILILFLLLQNLFFFSSHLSEENMPSNNIRQTPVGLRRLCKAVKNDNTLKTNHKCLPTLFRNNRNICLGSLSEWRCWNTKESKCQNEGFNSNKVCWAIIFVLFTLNMNVWN